MVAGNTIAERLVIVAKRFDPELDGQAYSVDESDMILAIGNEALTYPRSLVGREYFERIATRQLFGG